MLTTEERTTTEVVPVADTEATPLTTAEANALLSLSASVERKPRVKAGTATERHWQRRGNVD